MWKLKLPHKVKMFSCLLILGRLHIRDRLSWFVNNIPSSCPMCNAEVENRAHLFLNCNFTRLVWNVLVVPNSIRLNHNLHFIDWLNELEFKVDVGMCDLSKALLICWKIWKERNQMVFQNKVSNHYWIVKTVLHPVSHNGNIPPHCSPIRWRPPDALFVKLNFDESVMDQGVASSL